MQLSLELEVQKLEIIIVSDIHLNVQSIEKLARKAKVDGYNFDYCLVGGDIANCDHESCTHNEESMVEQTKECLAKLHDLLQCKVLWIPGNHDPLSFFNGEQHICHQIINIHKREYVLEAGLRIVGLGGSLPAYLDQEQKSQQWCGFPYKSEAEYSKDLQVVFKEDEIKTSKIYFTHVGPSGSSTTIDRKKENPVYAGSKSLNNYVERDDLLVLIHGHVHHGGRYDLYKSKPIINPGALLFGEYAVLKLVRSHKIWKMSKISFEKLI